MKNGEIISVAATFNPLDQTVKISQEPQSINIQTGYFAIKSDDKLTMVRNWLKEKNIDLASAVLVSSMAKPILFGTAYKF